MFYTQFAKPQAWGLLGFLCPSFSLCTCRFVLLGLAVTVIFLIDQVAIAIFACLCFSVHGTTTVFQLSTYQRREWSRKTKVLYHCRDLERWEHRMWWRRAEEWHKKEQSTGTHWRPYGSKEFTHGQPQKCKPGAGKNWVMGDKENKEILSDLNESQYILNADVMWKRKGVKCIIRHIKITLSRPYSGKETRVMYIKFLIRKGLQGLTTSCSNPYEGILYM